MAGSPLENARRLLLDPGRCPGCGTALSTPRCRACGLDLSGAAGAQVWEVSRAAADALARHAEVVDRVRSQQVRHAQVTPPAAAPTFVPPTSLPPAPAPPAMAPAAAHAGGYAGRPPTAPSAAPSHAPGTARRPWRVQTVLVTLGAALLALASLVFLVFTWELLTLPVRAAFVAIGTAGVLALAVLLVRRGLRQSAEAVAALGSALLALDVWALWATGMLPPAPGWLVGGVGLAVCGALLAAYGLRTGLRAGTVAAAVLVPSAPLLLAAAAHERAVTVTALLTSLALATLRHLPALGARAAERRVLTVFAVGTGVAAAFTSLVALGPRGPLTPAVILAAIATVAGLAVQSWLARGASGPVWAAASGLLAAFGAALAVPALPGSFVPWSAPAAALLAAAFGLRTGRRLTAAGTAAAVMAGVLGLPDVVLLTVDGVVGVLAPGRTPAEACVPAAVTTVALVVLAGALGLRVARPARHVAAALTCLGLLAGVPLALNGVAATVAGLAVLALVAAVAPLPGPWYRHSRPLAVVAAAAAVVAGLRGAAGGAPTSDAVAHVVALVVAALVAFVAGRWGRAAARATPAGAAVVLVTFALAGVTRLLGAAPADAACLAAAVVGTLVVALALARVASQPERLAALAAAALVQALTWYVVLVTHVDAGDRPAGWSVALVTALPALAAVQTAALAALGRRRVGVPVRQAAAALVAPALALALTTAHLVADRPDLPETLVGAVVLGCAAALVGRATPFRVVLEVSGAAVVLVAVVSALGAPDGVLTLQLTLAAVTSGVVGLARDRRALRWCALGLAVLASWTGLAVRDVGTPEAYAAPLGLVLATIGLRRVRAGIRTAAEPTARAVSGPSLLAAGVLLVGTPPALVDDPLVIGSVTLDRTVLLTVGALALALGAVRLAGASHALTRRAAWLTGACAALLAVLGPLRRAVVVLLDDAATPVEAWSLPAALVLALVTLTARRSTSGRSLVAPGVWGTLLAAAAPTIVAAQAQVVDDAQTSTLRLAVVGLGGTAVALVGVLRASRDLTLPGLTVLTLAGLTGALAASSPLPADAWLALTGALAGVVGTTWLVRTPAARSWPALGAPAVLVLGPVLVALQADPEPWRWVVVLLGGTAAVLAGAVRRWQAPFVVGTAVLAVEIVVQLVAAAASVVTNVGWWPLLFLGGAALTVVGVTYEKRMRDAREATRYVARMR